MTADELALRYAEEQPEATRRRELVWQDPMPTAGAGAEMSGIDYMRALVAGQHAATTLTLEVKMVRPILSDTGRVRAEAEVIHRGRRQATVEAKLYAVETEKLLAQGSSTCMIL